MGGQAPVPFLLHDEGRPGADEGHWQARPGGSPNPTWGVCTRHSTLRYSGSQGGDPGSKGPRGERSDLGQVAEVSDRTASCLCEREGALQEGPAAQPRRDGQVGRGPTGSLRGPPEGLQQSGDHEDQGDSAAQPGGDPGVAKAPGRLRGGAGRRHDGCDGGNTWRPSQGVPRDQDPRPPDESEGGCRDPSEARIGTSWNRKLQGMGRLHGDGWWLARRSKEQEAGEGEGIPIDPYMTSPSRNTLVPEPEARTPSRTRPKSQRTPVKLLGRRPAPSPKPGSALAKRLEAKRRTALASFKIHGGDISDEEEDEVMVGALARQEEVPEEIVEWVHHYKGGGI